MNKRFKELTVKMADVIRKESFDFMLKNLNKEEETSDLMNLILSAHLSSCFSNMLFMSSDNKEIEKRVIKFVTDMESFLERIPLIKGVEHI